MANLRENIALVGNESMIGELDKLPENPDRESVG